MLNSFYTASETTTLAESGTRVYGMVSTDVELLGCQRCRYPITLWVHRESHGKQYLVGEKNKPSISFVLFSDNAVLISSIVKNDFSKFPKVKWVQLTGEVRQICKLFMSNFLRILRTKIMKIGQFLTELFKE